MIAQIFSAQSFFRAAKQMFGTVPYYVSKKYFQKKGA